MLRTMSKAAVISLLIASPAYAGFYIGASIGPEGAKFSRKALFQQPAINSPFGGVYVIDKDNYAGTGGFGSLFGGYAWSHNRYYLAAEINANLSSLKYSHSNNEYVHQTFLKTYYKIGTSQGVSILPGYYVTDTLVFYGRLGYANGKLKIVEGADPTIPNFSKNRSGFRYGLGVRQALTPRLTGMLEYSQINYQSVTGTVIGSNFRKDTKITPLTAQVAFGLIYKFDGDPVYVK